MMAARLYNTERWTEEDDRLLRTMSETGKSLNPHDRAIETTDDGH